MSERTTAREFIKILEVPWGFWSEFCGNEFEALQQQVMKNEVAIRLRFLDDEAKATLREFGRFLLENIDEPRNTKG